MAPLPRCPPSRSGVHSGRSAGSSGRGAGSSASDWVWPAGALRGRAVARAACARPGGVGERNRVDRRALRPANGARARSGGAGRRRPGPARGVARRRSGAHCERLRGGGDGLGRRLAPRSPRGGRPRRTISGPRRGARDRGRRPLRGRRCRHEGGATGRDAARIRAGAARVPRPCLRCAPARLPAWGRACDGRHGEHLDERAADRRRDGSVRRGAPVRCPWRHACTRVRLRRRRRGAARPPRRTGVD